MSIKYAILGLLSWRPSSGYDLKKFFEESPAMYWSGNNNQIYKALVQLSDEGLVTNKVQHQEGAPSKKIYSITESGLDELREWVLSAPEPPACKKSFLVQLAWADLLSSEELNELLLGYEKELNIQILMLREKERRGLDTPGRSPRESFLWDKIMENLVSSYNSELDWVRNTRLELLERKEIKGESKMKYNIIENKAGKYIEFISAPSLLGTEEDALDLVALCGENDTNLLVIHGGALSGDFFRLKTGVAGKMLQKLINYRVKTAVVNTEKQPLQGKFREMTAEANKGCQFGVFENMEAAEKWLLG